MSSDRSDKLPRTAARQRRRMLFMFVESLDTYSRSAQTRLFISPSDGAVNTTLTIL